jgi:hypothetical protein
MRLSTNLDGRLKERFDGFDHPRIFGFDLRPEAPHHAAVAPDQELLEVPADVAGPARVVGGLGEDGVEGMPRFPFDVQPTVPSRTPHR